MKRIFLLHILAALAVAVAACPAACALAHEEGDTVLFGRWEQDGDPSNGPEPIEWIVAEQQDGASVLISSCTLDVRPFHGKAANVTWETSSLRAWLNGEFFRKAFSESEKESMIAASVAAERNPLGGGNPGNSTKDKVFVPSLNEVDRWFSSDEERACPATEAVAGETPYIKEGFSPWWLRTPGKDNKNVALVTQKGKIYAKGGPVHDKRAPVRVCIVLGEGAESRPAAGGDVGKWDFPAPSQGNSSRGGTPAPKPSRPKLDADGWEILN